MSVLIMAPSAYVLGGVQNWLDYLLPGLEAAGLEPILGLAHGQHHRSSQYLQQHPWHRVAIIRNPTGSATGRINAIAKTIKRLNPALVISVNIGDCLAAMRLLKHRNQTNARLIMTLHGVEPDYLADLKAYSDVIDVAVYTNKLLGKLIPGISDFDSSRLIYAPYGVDISLQQPARESNPGRVLWMGRLDQDQKRCMELPDIVSRLGQDNSVAWQLQIAGNGPMRKPLLKALAPWIDTDDSAPGESPQVSYQGAVSHQKILTELLPGADMLLVNSRWETGPITIWEAMAAGVPVVSSRYTGSGAEGALIDGENALLFDVGDVSAAAACLQRLSEDRGLHQKLADAGRKLVARRYSVEASVAGWIEALQFALSLSVQTDIKLPQPEPVQGRLDRWLGVDRAEKIRSLLGIGWQHSSPGGEWPHSRNRLSTPETEAFERSSVDIDRKAWLDRDARMSDKEG